MVLGAYLKLDQSTLYRNNFSSDSKFTGTIYTDKNLTTAFNLTGYTLKLRFHREFSNNDLLNVTASITTAASGTFNYAFTSGDMPTPGIYLCSVELTKSGSQINTLNRNEVYIKIGAST